MPDFMLHIAQVLNKRLAGSSAVGYSGDINISFYSGGLTMGFKDGKLIRAADWGPTKDNNWDDAGWNARFPGLVFLQLLFGFRSVDDLLYSFPEASVDSTITKVLLDTLFPKQPSRVLEQ
jgi:hypothetical protein